MRSKIVLGKRNTIIHVITWSCFRIGIACVVLEIIRRQRIECFIDNDGQIVDGKYVPAVAGLNICLLWLVENNSTDGDTVFVPLVHHVADVLCAAFIMRMCACILTNNLSVTQVDIQIDVPLFILAAHQIETKTVGWIFETQNDTTVGRVAWQNFQILLAIGQMILCRHVKAAVGIIAFMRRNAGIVTVGWRPCGVACVKQVDGQEIVRHQGAAGGSAAHVACLVVNSIVSIRRVC